MGNKAGGLTTIYEKSLGAIAGPQYVAGMVAGRDSTDQIIYAKLMGTGIADVAAAKLAYETAKTAGVGMEMDW